jgi:hypothetical protein
MANVRCRADSLSGSPPGSKRRSELEARPRKHQRTVLENDLEAGVDESHTDYDKDDVREFIEMRDV